MKRIIIAVCLLVSYISFAQNTYQWNAPDTGQRWGNLCSDYGLFVVSSCIIPEAGLLNIQDKPAQKRTIYFKSRNAEK